MDALSSYLNTVLEDTTVFISGNVQTSALALIIATSLFCSVLATVSQLLMECHPNKLVVSQKDKGKDRDPNDKEEFPSIVAPFKKKFEFNAKNWRWKHAYAFRKDAMFKRKVLKALANSDSKEKQKYNRDLLPELMLQTKYVIDLSLKYLVACPNRLGYEGCHIKYLDLSHNMISLIPDEITLLKGLEYFDVSNNQLQKLPKNIGFLSNLKYVDVHHNQLQCLPDSVCYLSKMKELNIENNELRELPENLEKLNNLLDIYAGNNRLETLPQQLFAIQSLEVLDISKNRIKELPDEIGNLHRLVILDVSDCQLTNLSVHILKCLSLSQLRANNNFIAELPDQLGAIQSLRSLEVKNNKLRYLPASLANRRFNTLKVSGNPICRLLRKISEDSSSCVESKFTSLVELTNRTIATNQYRNVEYLPRLYRTFILDEKVCFGCKKKIFHHFSRQIQPQLFGGQIYAASVYYCTPQLSRKCLYLQEGEKI